MAEDRAGPAVRKTPGKRVADQADPQVAAALRSAYEEAVQEEIPSEFLDLLGKLA